jgi:hypothetical protein
MATIAIVNMTGKIRGMLVCYARHNIIDYKSWGKESGKMMKVFESGQGLALLTFDPSYIPILPTY